MSFKSPSSWQTGTELLLQKSSDATLSAKEVCHSDLPSRENLLAGGPAATTVMLRPCSPHCCSQLRIQHNRDTGAGSFVSHTEALKWTMSSQDPHDLAAWESEALPSSSSFLHPLLSQVPEGHHDLGIPQPSPTPSPSVFQG